MWQTKYDLAVPKNLGLGFDLIFGCAVKMISSPGVCSPCLLGIKDHGRVQKVVFITKIGQNWAFFTLKRAKLHSEKQPHAGTFGSLFPHTLHTCQHAHTCANLILQLTVSSKQNNCWTLFAEIQYRNFRRDFFDFGSMCDTAI